MPKESYSICLKCGELSTFSQRIEACSNGGMPYCYCEFGGERGRIFIGYRRINKQLWEKLKEFKKNKLRLKVYIQYKITTLNRKGKE